MNKFPLLAKTFFAFVTFLIIIIIIMGLIINYSIINYTESEIAKSSIGKLNVSKNISAKILDGVVRDTFILSENPSLNPGLVEAVKNMKGINKAEEKTKILEMMDSLIKVEKANDEINSIYIYLEDAQFVLSSKYGLHSIEDFNDTEWLQYYETNKVNDKIPFWLNSRKPYNSNNDSNSVESNLINDNSYVLSFIYPLTAYTTQVKGAIIVNLYMDKLNSQINGEDLENQGYIFIIDSKTNVMTHVDRDKLGISMVDNPDIKKIIESNKEKGYLIGQDKNSRQLITYYKSDFYNWIYIGVFQMDSLMLKVKGLQNTILEIMILILVFGVVISYVISRNIYSPVKKLVQDIKDKKGIDIFEENNEVSILSKAFESILREENQINSTMQKHLRDTKINYIMHLIKGIESDDEQNDKNILDFQYPYYFSIVGVIDRYKDFANTYSKEERYYIKTWVLGIIEEVLNQHFKCTGILLEDEKMVLIVNTDKSDFEKNTKIISNKFDLIKNEISKIMDNTITISIGSVKDNINDIKASYSEAIDFLKLKLIVGHESMITYQEGRVDERKYSYPFALEKHVINNVSVGSKEATLSSIGEFIDYIKSNNESYDNTVLMLNQLLASAVRFLLDSNISVSDIFGNDFNIHRQLLENETLDDVGIWFVRIFLQIIEYRRKIQVDDKKYIDVVIDYIHKNYKRDIDINVLAEHVGISYSQLRRVFISETGNNMVEYINNLRIEEAKRLLRQTESSIPEIALSLGYNNDRSFSRFFKKYEGITPGEFRRIKN